MAKMGIEILSFTIKDIFDRFAILHAATLSSSNWLYKEFELIEKIDSTRHLHTVVLACLQRGVSEFAGSRANR